MTREVQAGRCPLWQGMQTCGRLQPHRSRAPPVPCSGTGGGAHRQALESPARAQLGSCWCEGSPEGWHPRESGHWHNGSAPAGQTAYLSAKPLVGGTELVNLSGKVKANCCIYSS